jgi:rubrerythrin
METKFNAFEIAERVEQRGAKFYVQTAKLFREEALQNVYYKLAEGKIKQQKAWAQMRKEFSEKTGEFGTYDPDNYVLSHPEVMAGLSWFGTRAGRAKPLRGTEKKEEILRDAVNRENAVIAFYQGLKNFAQDPAGTQTVETIIAKENQCVRMLIQEITLLD